MRGNLDPHGKTPEDVKEKARKGILEKENAKKGILELACDDLQKNVKSIYGHFVNKEHVCESYLYSIHYYDGPVLKQEFLGINADDVRKQFPEIDLRIFYNFDLEAIDLISKKGMSVIITRT